MPILTVREDVYGVYVKTNGGIYRPVATRHSYYRHIIPSVSSFKKGDKPKGGAISQSPDCRVGDEVWTCHGEYMYDGGKHKPSTDCWEGE